MLTPPRFSDIISTSINPISFYIYTHILLISSLLSTFTLSILPGIISPAVAMRFEIHWVYIMVIIYYTLNNVCYHFSKQPRF